MSVELIARLAAYPKMEALLNSLPPGLLALSAERAAEPAGRRTQAAVTSSMRRIEDATFTGKGDKPKVVALYKDYVSRTVNALARTALASAEMLAPRPATRARGPLRMQRQLLRCDAPRSAGRLPAAGAGPAGAGDARAARSARRE